MIRRRTATAVLPMLLIRLGESLNRLSPDEQEQLVADGVNDAPRAGADGGITIGRAARRPPGEPRERGLSGTPARSCAESVTAGTPHLDARCLRELRRRTGPA